MLHLRNILYGVICVTIGCVIAFGLAELAVRTFSPQEVGPVRFVFNSDLGPIPVPYQHGVRHYPGVYDFSYTNNSRGWRGRREYREGKLDGSRVLLLGDSFVYGFGVNDDQTFAALIEKDLSRDHLAVEVINAGNPGKGTDYALKFFETVGRKFHPDITVLGFFPNDFQDNERGEYYNVKKAGGLAAKPLSSNGGIIKSALFHLPAYNWLISWSQAANLVKEAAVKTIINRGRRNGPEATNGLVISYDRGVSGYATAANKPLTGIYVKQLHASVKRAGGELMMFYIPISQEVLDYRRTRAISPDERAIQRLAADNGMMLWSLTPLLAHSGQSIAHLYYKEGHWTAAAHALAASYLSRLIQSGLSRRRQLMQPSQK